MTDYVKFVVNLGDLPSCLKFLMIDSEQVP